MINEQDILDIEINLIQYTKKENIFDGFKDVVGQSKAIDKLNFYIKSHGKETPCPTFLFSGSHGLGKTYVAKRVAKSLGRKYVEINCANIKNADALFDIFTNQVMGTTPVTLLLDECHDLNDEISNILLSILNPNKEHKNKVIYKKIPYVFDLSLINVIFATTDAYMMFAPLKNRATNIYFEQYESLDIINMLAMYLPGVEFACDKKDLADACRNRGRDTFLLANNLKRFLNLKSEDLQNVLTENDWKSFKDLFEIYPLGLNYQEVELLTLIGQHEPISASNLALKMMVNERNIKDEMEIRLRETGLISSSTRGRILSEEGKKYIEDII